MRIVVVACFLNEARHLPRFLESMRSQVRLPDRLVLVDDGSADDSPDIARRFCESVDFAELLIRPSRPPEADRLATAGELRAFQWALGRLDGDYDIVVKMDADLDLTATLFARMEEEFQRDPALGVAGAFLSAKTADGRIEREHCPLYHVRGPNKFYRRDCYEQIQPIEPFLGWDTVDEVKARMRGWRAHSVAIPEGDPIHLRPTGSHDGALRAYRRWGYCAYGYGAGPLFVLLKTILYSATRRPRVLSGANFLWGFAAAWLRREPRVPSDIRTHMRSEHRRLLAALIPPKAARTVGR